MQKDLERKLNNFKKIKASNDWKADLKSELFQEEEHFLLEVLQPKLAFGSLVMAGLALTFIIIGTANDYPEIERVRKIDSRANQVVQMMQQENDLDEESMEDPQEPQMGMMATDNEDDSDLDMMANVDFDSLTESEQREIIKESAQELMAELDEVEERLVRVLGSR